MKKPPTTNVFRGAADARQMMRKKKKSLYRTKRDASHLQTGLLPLKKRPVSTKRDFCPLKKRLASTKRDFFYLKLDSCLVKRDFLSNPLAEMENVERLGVLTPLVGWGVVE